MDKELKTLVRNEALWLGVPPTLRFVFETSERIEINLLEEKAAMGFLKRVSSVAKQLYVSSVAKQGILGKIVKKARLPRLRVGGSALGAVSKGTTQPNVGSFIPS
jgi:hypothetical protein